MTFNTVLICFDTTKLLANEGQTTFPSILSSVRTLGITKASQSRFAGSGFLSEHSPTAGAAHPCVSLSTTWSQVLLWQNSADYLHSLSSLWFCASGCPWQQNLSSWQALLSCSVPAPGLQTAASKPSHQLCKEWWLQSHSCMVSDYF